MSDRCAGTLGRWDAGTIGPTRRNVGGIANHYERLGVRPDASAADVRTAYRRAARAAHPDRHGEASSARMADVNEAWRIVGDPLRRMQYDRQLRVNNGVSSGTGSAVPPSGRPTTSIDDDDDDDLRFPNPMYPHYGPMRPSGRFPWRLIVWLSIAGSAVVILGVILSGPAQPGTIDNVLRSGDCVILSSALDARETLCSGEHDATVTALVPFDQTCPTGTEKFRDRQGMGNACVVRVVDQGG